MAAELVGPTGSGLGSVGGGLLWIWKWNFGLL